MKVIYFHQHFSTPKGSTGIRSYEMAKKLIASGHQVTMVCGSYAGGNTGINTPFNKGRRSGEVDGIKIIELELAYANTDGFIKRTLTFLKFAFASILIALKEDYDVLFATSTPLTAGIPGIFARWLRRKPFVFEVRDLWPELPREMGVITNPLILKLMSILEWTSYHSAHRCIGLSPGIVDGIKSRGVADNKVIHIPNGCDIGIFNNEAITPWRPSGVRDDDFMAIFTGTHGIANGLDSVIDVAIELKKRNRDNIKIVLIGQGKLKPRLQERANKHNLSNVIFHDPVNKSKLAGLMKSADIGLQILANVPAFYYGTSPNKFFDYIAAGLPVLNNYPGWLAELILENQCGYTVPPDDAIEFANTLEKAFNNRDILPDMAKNASLLAKEKFNRAILSDNWVNWVINESRAKI